MSTPSLRWGRRLAGSPEGIGVWTIDPLGKATSSR
jgi:hypothetical protein